MVKPDSPKVFVSYSWTPAQHQQKVIEFAKQLSADGVHVIIDVWDLNTGQDKYHFMERMVNDSSVKKVLLICNKDYAAKANNRKGGVGDESQIITTEIYSSVEQTKFIPVIFEFDESGHAYMPTMISNRIYIDLFHEEKYYDEYQKLLRDIYGKPSSTRPPIGDMPVFLKIDEPTYLPTSNKVNILRNAIVNEKQIVPYLIQDYLDTFLRCATGFEIPINILNDNNYIEEIEKKITESKYLRDDFIEFLDLVVSYSKFDKDQIHIFLEKFTSFIVNLECLEGSHYTFGYMRCDAILFFYHEFFLLLTSYLNAREQYIELAHILHTPLIIENKRRNKFEETNFLVFRNYVRSLNEKKKKKFNLNTNSVVSDMFKARVNNRITWDNILEADKLLYCISLLFYGDDKFYWYAETSEYYVTPILTKTCSKRFFDKAKVLFKVDTKEGLLKSIDAMEKRTNNNVANSIRQILKVNEMCTIS